jgi:hypothetical protein
MDDIESVGKFEHIRLKQADHACDAAIEPEALNSPAGYKSPSERTGVPIVVVTESKFLAEIDSSHEVSIRVVVPNAVSEFASPWRSRASTLRGRHRPLSDRHSGRAPRSRRHPDLVGVLDEVAAGSELDVPKTNYKTGFWLCLPEGSGPCCTVRGC